MSEVQAVEYSHNLDAGTATIIRLSLDVVKLLGKQ